jgi:hypothetical protein
MAVGWTVAATAGANRPAFLSLPTSPESCSPESWGSGPAPLFNLLLTNHFSLITVRLAVGSSVRAHLTLAGDDQVMENARNHASIYIEVEGIDALWANLRMHKGEFRSEISLSSLIG